jgi:hypothetical protein
MSYVTSSQFQSLIPLAVSLPLTELEPEEWLVISSTVLSGNQSFSLSWLQVNLLSYVDTTSGADTLNVNPTADGVCVFPSGSATLVTPGYGLAYVGLYSSFNALVSPNTQPAQENPLILGTATSIPPVFAARTTTPAVYAETGPYSFVICNNTTSWALRLTVSGQYVVNLGPPPS